MPSLENGPDACLLISIEAVDRDGLFDCYRDYLVFMSLVRDGVRNSEYKVYGFCWIKTRCLMIIQPQNQNVGNFLLRLLRRYHFWLLQRGPSMTEFRLQILELQQNSWTLDCLRFLHQQAVNENMVDDAMDYHWHSHHVYNGFWSVNWLDTAFILEQFASNRLVAMNRFRQYMLHGHRLDFCKMLESDDCSNKYISYDDQDSLSNAHRAVSEINSQYHQSLLDRTEVSLVSKMSFLHVMVSVASQDWFTEDEQATVMAL